MNEEQRRKTRERVKRYRARHRQELQLRAELRPGGTGTPGRRPQYVVIEWRSIETGLPVMIVVARVDALPDPPAGCVVERRFLPSGMAVSLANARQLMAMRIEQVRSWGLTGFCRL